MAARKTDVSPPKVLRTHRPRHPDAQPPRRPPADVVEEREVITEDLPVQRSWLREHLHEIGIGMLAMLVFWYLGTTYVLPFVTNTVFHWNCGRPPGICQYDLNVGHGTGKSHFMTQYWHDEVLLIEIVDDDPQKTKIYGASITEVGGDKDTHFVTLEARYVGDHPLSGKPDLVATISGFATPVVFYNTGTEFTTEERK